MFAFVLVVAPSGSVCSREPSSMGCYADPFPTPAGSTHVLNLPAGTTLSLERCVSLCCSAGFGVGSLVGLKNGSSCFCDNDTGPYPLVKRASCNITCADSQTCGGADSVSLYGVTSCAFLPAPELPYLGGVAPAPPPHLQACGVSGCTLCPAGDQCCVDKEVATAARLQTRRTPRAAPAAASSQAAAAVPRVRLSSAAMAPTCYLSATA